MASMDMLFFISASSGGVTTVGPLMAVFRFCPAIPVMPVMPAGPVISPTFLPGSVPTMAGWRRSGGVISVLQSCIRDIPGVYVS